MGDQTLQEQFRREVCHELECRRRMVISRRSRPQPSSGRCAWSRSHTWASLWKSCQRGALQRPWDDGGRPSPPDAEVVVVGARPAGECPGGGQRLHRQSRHFDQYHSCVKRPLLWTRNPIFCDDGIRAKIESILERARKRSRCYSDHQIQRRRSRNEF